MRPPHPTLTAQELAIMKIVWRTGTVTVRDVYRTLADVRPVAYTTVMTMMNILETKGYLKKEKHDRAFKYRPIRAERTVISSMVREFVQRVFDGASAPLLLHLARDRRLTEDERDTLSALINASTGAHGPREESESPTVAARATGARAPRASKAPRAKKDTRS